MPKQGNPDEDSEERFSEETIDNIVLTLILCRESWPWSVEEVERDLGGEGNAIDALRRLTESGLVHRFGEFVFPTRSARRAVELQVGTV